MNPDITNPDDLTLDVFNNTLLPRAAFTLLGEKSRDAYARLRARDVYAGAGPRCLYAIVDGLEILSEAGDFYVYGMHGEANEFAPWCVLFSDAIPDGGREQVL